MECSGGETSPLLEGTFALPGPSLEDSGLSVVTIRVKQRHKTRSIHQVRGTLECGDGSEKKKKNEEEKVLLKLSTPILTPQTMPVSALTSTQSWRNHFPVPKAPQILSFAYCYSRENIVFPSLNF